MLGHFRDGHPRLTLILPGAQDRISIEFIVDTGFEGDLALEQSLIARLLARLSGADTFALADGSHLVCPTYDLILDWDGEERHVEALATAGHPLLGTRLLEGVLLQVEMNEGGEVLIERI
jgi:clan AA aspartic protease